MFEEILKQYLVEWHTKKEIINHLKSNGIIIQERGLRKLFEQFNERYFNDENELYIAHSCKGYLLTADTNIIGNSIIDDKKRALKLLKRYQKTSKKVGNKNQINLEVYPIKEDIFELLMTGDNYDA